MPTLPSAEALVKRLAAETDAVRRSAFFQEYLAVAARFWNYSFYNQLLIQRQFPQATRVAGFRQWQKLGRQVVQGSKAIRILAPFTRKAKVVDASPERAEEETRERPTFFRPVCVFDVSQTLGEPLPSMDLEVRGDSQRALLEQLLAYCARLGVEVRFKELGVNGVYGYSGKGTIVVAANQAVDDQANTLVHELAHTLLHQECLRNHVSHACKEIQAEGVAYVVAKALGVESKAPEYLALEGADTEQILANLEAIAGTARKVLAWVHPRLV